MQRLSTVLRCSQCGSGMTFEPQQFRCTSCSNAYQCRGGIVDTLPASPEDHRFATRVLHKRTVVGIYERYWRPALCRVVTNTHFVDQARMVQRALRARPGQIVLDIGAGTGNFSRVLSDVVGPTGLVVSVDLSERMLAAAASEAAASGRQNIMFVRGDAEQLPFKTESVDGINCCGALHLFKGIEKGVSEFARVLREGGRFSCLTFSRGEGATRAVLKRSRALIGMEFFEPRSLETMIRAGGFGDYLAEQERLMLVFGATRSKSA